MKLLESLRLAAIEVPTWHLTNGHRWRLLRDTLLGHVKVRGAIRPRDLPLDTSCQSVIDAATDVLDLPPYEAERGTRVHFRHWFAAFTTLQLSLPCEDRRSALTDEELLTATILEMAFAMNTRVLRKADGVADLPIVHRLIGILGMSQQEWRRLVSEYMAAVRQNTAAPHDALLARTAAIVTALESPPLAEASPDRASWHGSLAACMTDDAWQQEAKAGKQGAFRRSLAALDGRKCCYVTLKVDRPQRYINRGKRHWLLRGASGWCSQSLALARDLLCLCDEKSLLFSDSDAIVGMWFPPHVTQATLRDHLEARLHDFWRLAPKAGDIERRFPRLTTWLAANLPDGVPLDRHRTIPALSLMCSAPMSVLDLCVHRFAKADRPSTDLARSTVEGSCTRVLGDDAVAFRSTPPWLQNEDDGNENEKTDNKLAVGITSIVWALCGTAFRTHAHEGLCRSFERLDAVRACLEAPLRPKPDTLVLQEIHHGGWLEQLRMRDESLVHVKMDGDGVGERFRASPVADYPWLSMQLARMVQRRLVAGVLAALKSCNVAGHDTVSTLPIDVVYVGGDDVYVIMPWPVLNAFFGGFAVHSPELATNPWRDTCFTFVAAKLSPKQVLLAGIQQPETTRRFAAANLAAARLVTEGLDRVKDEFKGKSVLDRNKLQEFVNNALKESHLADHQMRIAVEEQPLICDHAVGDGRRILRGRVIHVGSPAGDL